LDNHITVAVIPAHNKGLLIGKTVHEVRAYVDHVIVVDNGSKTSFGVPRLLLG
jgi:energy-coupling factor transporter ATP-binding protein EcfA2